MTKIKGADGSERRVQPRHELMLQVQYQHAADFIESWTENISAGGFFFRTEGDFEQGQTIRVKLSFSGLLDPFEVQGRVAWLRPAGTSQPAGVGVCVETERSRRHLARIALQVEKGLAEHKIGERYRVLVVDDNEHSQETCRWVLKDIDRMAPGSVEVDFASDGHEALDKISQQKPDLLICDIFMPVMDGITLIKTLRQNPALRSLPVIVVTSGGENERREMEQAEVQAFLHKPVRFSKLLETIVYLIFLLDQRARPRIN